MAPGSDPLPHLFRTEFRRITAALCRQVGIDELQAAEDLAMETFVAALETWPYRGVPDEPAAWLHTVARHKARNYLSRRRNFDVKISTAWRSLQDRWSAADWTEGQLQDSQLQMMFALCHPDLAEESQIGLSLRILCGFGIDEIATAFFEQPDTVTKRLYRARQKLRDAGVSMEWPGDAELGKRLDTVMRVVYLLFSEGYYSESHDAVLREDLCLEAMRLTKLLLDHHATATPNVRALYAMMCFYASRFKARLTVQGDIILYDEQDNALWNQAYIQHGSYYLHQASVGDTLSRWHLEAALAYWLTVSDQHPEKWRTMLSLYEHLLKIEASPVAAISHAWVLSKVAGKAVAREAALKLPFEHNQFYQVLMAELYTGDDTNKARAHFEAALKLVRTAAQRKLIERRLALL